MTSLIVPASPNRSPSWVRVAVETARRFISGITEVVIAHWGMTPSDYGYRTVCCNPFGRCYNGGLVKNVGARHTTGEHLLFLDADAELKGRIDLVAGVMTTSDVCWTDERGVVFKQNGGWVGCVLISMPRVQFEELHGFCESFPDWGGEDINLVNRYRSKEWPFRINHEPTLYHRWHRSIKFVMPDAVRAMNMQRSNQDPLEKQPRWGENRYHVGFVGPIPSKLPRGIDAHPIKTWDDVIWWATPLVVGRPSGKPPRGWVRAAKITVVPQWKDALRKIPAGVGRDHVRAG